MRAFRKPVEQPPLLLELSAQEAALLRSVCAYNATVASTVAAAAKGATLDAFGGITTDEVNTLLCGMFRALNSPEET